jgi:hypothetical protein
MTEAQKQNQRERLEQTAQELGVELDATSRKIADNARTNRKDTLWTFLLGVTFGVSLGALTVGVLVWGGAVVIP